MTYTVSVQNAKTGWVIATYEAPDITAALAQKTKWFREFHSKVEYDALDRLRPERIHLPVHVSIDVA